MLIPSKPFPVAEMECVVQRKVGKLPEGEKGQKHFKLMIKKMVEMEDNRQ
jgi:hypothetical protein